MYFIAGVRSAEKGGQLQLLRKRRSEVAAGNAEREAAIATFGYRSGREKRGEKHQAVRFKARTEERSISIMREREKQRASSRVIVGERE